MSANQPTLSAEDVSVITSAYPFGEVLELQNLGGLSNLTYKVVTPQRTLVMRVHTHSSPAHLELELKVLQHLARMGFASPRLLVGNDGHILQAWNGYAVSVSEFIAGVSADQLPLTPQLVGEVGRLVASFQRVMASYPLGTMPMGEAWSDKGFEAMRSFEAAVEKKNLEVDSRRVRLQWEHAAEAFVGSLSRLPSNIIHADLWPPNVICEHERAIGLIDFDACGYGAVMIDVAQALMEFAIVQTGSLNEALALAFLANYFRHGGSLSNLEESLMVSVMEMVCAMLVAWEAIESPTLAETEAYLRMLNLLHDDRYKEKLRGDMERLIAAARTQFRLMQGKSDLY